MLKNISQWAACFLLKKHLINKDLLAVYEYGFQLFFSTLFGAVSITLLSVILFDIRYALVFLLFFMPLRTFTGGYHCKTYAGCFVVSNLYFVLTVIVSRFAQQAAENPLVWILPTVPLLLIYVFLRAPVSAKGTVINKSAIERGKKFSKYIISLELLVICLMAAIFKTKTYSVFAYLTICLDAALMLVTEAYNIILNKNDLK